MACEPSPILRAPFRSTSGALVANVRCWWSGSGQASAGRIVSSSTAPSDPFEGDSRLVRLGRDVGRSFKGVTLQHNHELTPSPSSRLWQGVLRFASWLRSVSGYRLTYAPQYGPIAVS